MKKILFIITGLSTGGAEMMLYKLLSGIDRHQFNPVVLSLMTVDYFSDQISNRIKDLDIPIHSLGLDPGEFSITKLFSLLKLVRQEQPDMIQGWMYHANLAAQLASLLTFKFIPTIWNIRHSLHP